MIDPNPQANATAFMVFSAVWLGLMIVTFVCAASGYRATDDPRARAEKIRRSVFQGLLKSCTLVGVILGLYLTREAYNFNVVIPVHHRFLGVVALLWVTLKWAIGGALTGWVAGHMGSLAAEKSPSAAGSLATGVTLIAWVLHTIFSRAG